MRFRMATYNIHRCIGRDGVTAPQRVAEVLRAIDADVVALQEVAYTPEGPGDVLHFLAEAAAAEAVAGPTLLEAKGRYGNALLTRTPPGAVRRVDISVPGREPRGILQVRLDLPWGPVSVMTTHLGLAIDERRGQMDRIVNHLERTETETLILMGDFNEWLPWGRPLRRVATVFDAPAFPAPATFPSRRPFLALDRIWVRSDHPLKSLRAFKEGSAPMASDHLPLVADLDF
jgi:endonuclease/exonuclease/phosphatase family metal-dependent hydrolase